MWLRLETTFHKDPEQHLLVSHDRILKRSRSPSEAASMIYISQHTSIPIPKVLDTFVVRGHRYIVMEYLKGAQNLKNALSALTADQKESIAQELLTHLRDMRSLPPPSPEAVCSVTGGPLRDSRIAHSPFGPFSSHADYHNLIGFSRNLELHGGPARVASLGQKSWRSVFSHCDLAPRNILVRNGRIAAIIDWEFAGWYPEYVEYACMEYACWDTPDWRDRICGDMDHYDDERYIHATLMN
ncbi:kinase-like protein [Auricularia subglabra TFB-10046 SS5]|nr:kinase-like protein [Auricularia subglabra TFB-10046 SS5]